MRIPKIFNFNWAGGSKLMPDANLQIILKWMERHPNFQVYFWIDKETQPLDLVSYYRQQFSALAAKEKLNVDLEKIVFKDITEDKIVTPHVRYEIDRLLPNYGSSSDDLRPDILKKYGGVYLDGDIAPGSLSLEDTGIFDDDSPEHRLFVDPNSQDVALIGNDFLICTPGNPLMHQIGELARFNYGFHEPKPYEQFDADHGMDIRDVFSAFYPITACCYGYNDQQFITESTPFMTGPLVVRLIAKPLLDQETPSPDGFVYSLPEESREVRRDLGMSWVGRRVRQYETPDAAIDDILKAIRFEITYRKFLALESHCQQLSEAAGIPLEKATERLITRFKAEKWDLSEVAVVENTRRNDRLSKFYEELRIPEEKFHHFPPQREDYDVELIAGVLSYITRAHEVKEVRDTLFDSVEEDFSTLEKSQQQKVINNVNYAIPFINQLIDRLHDTYQEADEKYLSKLETYCTILDGTMNSYKPLLELKNFPKNMGQSIERTVGRLEEIKKLIEEQSDSLKQKGEKNIVSELFSTFSSLFSTKK